jgi:hypothetical protein
MNVADFLLLILIVFAAIIDVLILAYLIRLKQMGCECAMDWRRYYIILYFGLSVLSFFFAIVFGAERNEITYVRVLSAVLLVIGIPNIIFIIQYVNKLKVGKCECSESMWRDIMYLIALIQGFLYIVLFLYFAFLVVYAAIFYKKVVAKNQKVSKLVAIRKIKKP